MSALRANFRDWPGSDRSKRAKIARELDCSAWHPSFHTVCLISARRRNVCYCEGFRIPALHGHLPSRREGAGVRKPPGKETASRKGAIRCRELWGFERRRRLLTSGRNDHRRRFGRIEHSQEVFSAGHGMIFFSAVVLARGARRIFGRASSAGSNDQRQ